MLPLVNVHCVPSPAMIAVTCDANTALPLRPSAERTEWPASPGVTHNVPLVAKCNEVISVHCIHQVRRLLIIEVLPLCSRPCVMCIVPASLWQILQCCLTWHSVALPVMCFEKVLCTCLSRRCPPAVRPRAVVVDGVGLMVNLPATLYCGVQAQAAHPAGVPLMHVLQPEQVPAQHVTLTALRSCCSQGSYTADCATLAHAGPSEDQARRA
jgi:hypothetical protein